ncbi:CoA protein activase [Phosphitispora sp. TUW77]|uniref:CoA protein activase n=1 Tax=Phosphitispora sp. TUW77 TaxID=3152361 RepID=UPI003AB6B13F
MKVTFPHMGNMYICLKAVLTSLGIDVVVPPMPSKRTITLGAQHSPEFACLPLKINMGNFIEAYEMGADTILMAGGIGPCRFGYYAQVEREILEDMGLKMNMVILEPPEKHISELLINLKQVTGSNSWIDVVRAIKFGWHKARAVDELEDVLHRIRPRELEPGRADVVYRNALKWIDDALDKKELKEAMETAMLELDAIPVDNERDVIRIGIVGEIYVMLEPFVNLEVERQLGRLGVEVERSIYLSEWINDHLFMGLLNMKGSKEARKHAPPYINHFVGGHGQETIGSTVLFANSKYDGVIQVQPFTCMPEIVAESIIPTVSKDLGIPAYCLIVDEHSGDAGVLTRLEAFVDLLARKKVKGAALESSALESFEKRGEPVCLDI